MLAQNSAARRIDKIGALFHFGKCRPAKHTVGLRRQRAVHREIVRGGKHGFKIKLRKRAFRVRGAGIKLRQHAKCRADGGNPLSDGAAADDAERFAAELLRRIHKGGKGRRGDPPALFYKSIIGGNAACVLQNHGKHGLRNGIGRIAARIANGDAVRAGIFRIDYIIAGCKQADIAQLWATGENFCVQYGFVEQNGIGIPQPLGGLCIGCGFIDAKLTVF